MGVGKILIFALGISLILAFAAFPLIFRPPPYEALYEDGRGAPGKTEGGQILDIPYVRGKSWYCSEASASMVLSYYEHDISQDEVHDNGYESFENMLPFLSRFLNCKYSSLSMSDLKEEIDEGDPVIIRISPGEYRHTLVVVGYDVNYFYVHDPSYGDFLRANPDVLLNYWKPTNFAAITFGG